MNKLGLKEPGFEIGERFQGKLENLTNYHVFKNLRLSTFPNHGLISKRPKELESRKHR